MKVDTSRIERSLRKLKSKDPILFRAVQKKINQIAQLDGEAIEHFKNLRAGLSGYKRVQISSLVLMFKREADTLIFGRLRHHDKAYRA